MAFRHSDKRERDDIINGQPSAFQEKVCQVLKGKFCVKKIFISLHINLQNDDTKFVFPRSGGSSCTSNKG